MEHSLLVWLLPTLALVAGVAIGFLVARLLPNAAPNRTQRQLDDIQERFDSYQNEVVTHFNSTATLVKNSPRAIRKYKITSPRAPTASPWTTSPASVCWPHCIQMRCKPHGNA